MNRLFLALLLALPLAVGAQGVGIGTPTPHPSAALDVAATTQGLLLPRLTAAQRAAIAQPAAGLLVFQTDGTVGLYYYNGVSWLNLTSGRVPDADGATPGGVSTLAGLAGAAGLANGPGAGARFDTPYGVAVDASGKVYVADSNNNALRLVSAAGLVTTLAAGFNGLRGVAVDAAGTAYVTDRGNHVIRQISPAGVVSILAGAVGVQGSTDGPAAAARFRFPFGIAMGPGGAVYVTDTGNSSVRRIAAGVVTTLATGLNTPTGMAVDAAGTMYVVETFNHVIRQISPAGAVSTLAGAIGAPGSADGPAAAARFNFPYGVALGTNGTLYVADASNASIRQITAGVVTTLAGLAGAGGSTDGTAAAARFLSPFGIAVDATGAVYVSDSGNDTIRVIR